MVYLDSSVALAHLLSEDVRPPDRLWSEQLIASRLTEYEVRGRLRALAFADIQPAVEGVMSQTSFVDLRDALVADTLEEVPAGVRTLDALHLASALFLRAQGVELQIATYDARLAAAASALGFELYPLQD